MKNPRTKKHIQKTKEEFKHYKSIIKEIDNEPTKEVGHDFKSTIDSSLEDPIDQEISRKIPFKYKVIRHFKNNYITWIVAFCVGILGIFFFNYTSILFQTTTKVEYIERDISTINTNIESINTDLKTIKSTIQTNNTEALKLYYENKVDIQVNKLNIESLKD